MAWCSLFGKMKSDVLYMCFALSDTEQVYLEPFRDTSLELNDLLWPVFCYQPRSMAPLQQGLLKNIGTIITDFAHNGFAQTHYVASNLISMSFTVVAKQTCQNYQMFHYNTTYMILVTNTHHPIRHKRGLF